MLKRKIKVGIIFGGISPEHEVSLSSAEGVVSNIDKNKFQVKEIYMDKGGDFWTGRALLQKIKQKKFPASCELMDINKLAVMIDVAFPVLHGAGGEDGTIQGFLKTLKIPFVGADILGSAVCLDKSVFNQLMVFNKIAKPKFVVLDFQKQKKEEIDVFLRQINKDLSFPVFVKAARLGSSVGVYKVDKYEQLIKNINKAKRFDNKIIIEEAIKDCLEIEVSVMGNSVKDYQVSLPGRVIPAAEFYDYDDKYINNQTKFELPACLPKEKIREIQNIALKAYQLADCQGFARVDFLLDGKLKVYLNEINTIPGFTPISMYPKLWNISGTSYQKLITKLILLALKK